MSLMVNPHFHPIDMAHYNGMIQQGINPNYMMHQQMVPHLTHLQNAQLLRTVPDYNSPSTPPNSMSPMTNKNKQHNSSTNTPNPNMANSPANLTNSPTNISSPISISNSSLNSPTTSSASPNLLNCTTNKRISITQQTCLVEEKFSKNGVQKNVHVVVKNNPFILTLTLLDSSLNFHQLTPEVQLVYDSESLKEVDSATVKPLEYKTRANEEGDQLTVELRIKVLSSQLEDMLFRAKVKIVDPRTRKEMSGLSVITHPIRVVSKPDQVKKKAKKRKRAPTDSLMDTLNRIEHQQREQQRLLKKLCFYDKDCLSTVSSNICNSNSESPSFNENECTKSSNEDSENDEDEAPVLNGKDDFQNAFKEFISAFKQLQCLDPDGADGAFKINTCANDAQTMCEILEMVKVELKKDNQFKEKCEGSSNNVEGGHGDSPCACKVCPYKQKVDHINQSYDTYFNMFNANSSVVPQIEYTYEQQQQMFQQQQQQQYLQQQQTFMDQQQQFYLQQQQQYLQQQQQQQQQMQQQRQLQQAFVNQQQSQQHQNPSPQNNQQQSQQQGGQTPIQDQQFPANNFIDFNSNNFINFQSGLFGDLGFSAV
ncbi:hypothetical protein CYY_002988 [Polysphondylium violaceum]|uniref:Transcriptional regulator n=1 Tax=Polysphondylium violaceum TaxID=133409 RepID=A0A8J4V0H4_9MYCE|nr:hypothetical protein CYY_002988 [Polysphondylium violaceum]